MISIDGMQVFRMLFVWPAVAGSTATLGARAILWFIFGRLTREMAVACLLSGAAAALAAEVIAITWDNTAAMWLAFTVGLWLLSLVLLVSCAQIIVEAWRQ